MLARAAARRGELFEARVRVAEAIRIDPRAVSTTTWEVLIRAHEGCDAVARASLVLLCAREPTGRALRAASNLLPQRLLRGARRRFAS